MSFLFLASGNARSAPTWELSGKSFGIKVLTFERIFLAKASREP